MSQNLTPPCPRHARIAFAPEKGDPSLHVAVTADARACAWAARDRLNPSAVKAGRRKRRRFVSLSRSHYAAICNRCRHAPRRRRLTRLPLVCYERGDGGSHSRASEMTALPSNPRRDSMRSRKGCHGYFGLWLAEANLSDGFRAYHRLSRPRSRPTLATSRSACAG